VGGRFGGLVAKQGGFGDVFPAICKVLAAKNLPSGAWRAFLGAVGLCWEFAEDTGMIGLRRARNGILHYEIFPHTIQGRVRASLFTLHRRVD
jgi:hypothetical protein